ncbi:hypothetical protein C7974DRAFT_455243 [Boeremia exigua]|uniref:uncharacterized protein n=1 Tax=Boeremia exigua TaxID=749465 RepID=UPI001E8CBA3B|nr:uncharacterized protein C7974DRAFT_455243 [Boeremia exigua]KAH6625289.1 hypothetical protein C7974DRAFT_455243 [Boeremia exigua]
MSDSDSVFPNVAFDPREPTPKAGVTTTIATRVEGMSLENADPSLHLIRRNDQATVLNDPTSTSVSSRTHTDPLANASSSGSLTVTTAKHGRRISTTITHNDVEKWMDRGTYGDEVPDNQNEVAENVACMDKTGVNAGQVQKTDTEDVDGLRKIEQDSHEDPSQAEKEITRITVESTAANLLADQEVQMADSIVVGMRCDHCGGKIVWTKAGDYLMVCQKCKEPQ